ncbi:MAG: hypothetical protein K8R67_02180 [Desulfobacteraceae bacterium]|nr:hypothetical protein [Desulfobacteraceae bacterium]
MKIFGNQFDFVVKVLDARKYPVDAGADDDELLLRLEYARSYTKVIMQVVISTIVLVACFYLIFKSTDQAIQKASFGLIGTVIGYWLR